MKNCDIVTREDVLVLIDNYRRNGQDSTELENLLQHSTPSRPKSNFPLSQDIVAELRIKSPVTQGECCICGVPGTLFSGVCEECFLPWATKVAEDHKGQIGITKKQMTYSIARNRMPRRSKVDKPQEKRFQIIDLAIRRGWFINPSKGMEVFIENIIKFGHCPCDKTRPDCPCQECESELATKGRCRCGLYWASYQIFRNTLRPLEGGEH